MTSDELRHNWTDAFIELVMNEASVTATDLSSETEPDYRAGATGYDRVLL